jgi:hypothetical protein
MLSKIADLFTRPLPVEQSRGGTSRQEIKQAIKEEIELDELGSSVFPPCFTCQSEGCSIKSVVKYHKIKSVRDPSDVLLFPNYENIRKAFSQKELFALGDEKIVNDFVGVGFYEDDYCHRSISSIVEEALRVFQLEKSEIGSIEGFFMRRFQHEHMLEKEHALLPQISDISRLPSEFRRIKNASILEIFSTLRTAFACFRCCSVGRAHYSLKTIYQQVASVLWNNAPCLCEEKDCLCENDPYDFSRIAKKIALFVTKDFGNKSIQFPDKKILSTVLQSLFTRTELKIIVGDFAGGKLRLFECKDEAEVKSKILGWFSGAIERQGIKLSREIMDTIVDKVHFSSTVRRSSSTYSELYPSSGKIEFPKDETMFSILTSEPFYVSTPRERLSKLFDLANASFPYPSRPLNRKLYAHVKAYTERALEGSKLSDDKKERIAQRLMDFSL